MTEFDGSLFLVPLGMSGSAIIILLAEASMGQMRTIMNCLNEFSKASGQWISVAKSRIYVSLNVSRDLAAQLESIAGMDVTRNLGNYLGMSVLHQRIDRTTYRNLLVKVNSRLADSSSLLSRYSQLCPIMPYRPSVSHSLFVSILIRPSKLLSRVRAKVRGNLVAWNKVCLPKSYGGLGLHRTSEMNTALLKKNDNAGIWGEVVRAKYGVNFHDGTLTCERKCKPSSTWQSVVKSIKSVLPLGTRWKIGDGNIVRFWWDTRLVSGPLARFLPTSSSNDYLLIVRDLATSPPPPLQYC
ncbi:hypothetical protein V2J09_022616 [Rumex salicifolius]